jgi:hypothetical protein
MKRSNGNHQLLVPGALVLLFVFVSAVCGQSSGGSFQINQSVVAGGGNQSGAGNFTVTGTAAQPAAGTLMQQDAFSQTGGFWPGGGLLTNSALSSADATGTYGGTVMLTATLTANGVNLSGRSLTFTLNGASVGVATTDLNGVATLADVSLSGINGGTYPGAVIAQFAGDLTFAPSTVTVQLIVQPATPLLQVAGGAFTYDGQPHPANVALTGVNNEALAPVVVLYNGAGAVPVNAGSYAINASFAGNQNYGAIADTTRSIIINKANQTITFAGIADKTFTDGDFNLSATASSNLSVSFGAAGNCTVNGSTVHLTGAGSCTISASQAGDSNFNAAVNVDRTFNIGKANQTITFGGLPNKTFGDTDFNVSATTSSNLTISFGAAGNCNINGGMVHLTGAGSCTITASQAGDANYNAAINVDRLFGIGKANQTITFAGLPNKTFGDADFNVSATTSATLSVSFTVAGACSVAGSRVHLTQAGVCTVTASQAGDTNFNLAAPVAQTFIVAQASSTTTLTSSANPSDLGQAVTFTATVNSIAGTPSGTVQFRDNGANLGNPSALNQGGIATLSTSGLTTGVHALTAVYSGDANFASSTGALAGSQVVGAQPTLSINDVSLAEGNSGTTGFIFTVTLASGGSLPVTVDYATADGTATAGSDYQATSGRLTFAPGDTQKTITVLVNGDSTNEPDETFFVNLSNPTNAAVTRSQGLGLIVNDDAPGIRLSAANYTVNEDVTDAVLTVVRGGDLSQPATVDYTTSDQAGDAPCNLAGGFASRRCDYEFTARTLHFAAGENTKTISIPIIDDTYVEGPETFTVTLSNPTGASLGSISSATVTIVDNDSIPDAPGAIGDTAFFVRMQYLDFLNREPDAAGFNFWTGNIDSCGADSNCRAVKRVDTSAAFFLSIEYQQTGYLVYRTNLSAFGKAPQGPQPVDWNQFISDTQALGENLIVNQAGWDQVLEQNKQDFMNRFVRRAEFAAAFPMTMAPADFADHLFANAGVTPSDSERQEAINEFGAAVDTRDMAGRARALRLVAENALLCQKEMNRAFVLMQYFGYLRRNPNAAPDTDFTGYNFWLQKLDSFNGNYVDAEMVKSFLVSREYQQRFGPE